MKSDRHKPLTALAPWIWSALAAFIAIVLPELLGGSVYSYDVVTVALIYALFTLSWDFFCGATGEISFGHTFFIGSAAYTTALVQSAFGLPPLLAILLGGGMGAVAGLFIGVLTLRHAGAVFTMMTMAAQLTLYRTLFIWSDVFGGEEGVFIPKSVFSDNESEYWLTVVLAVGALLLALLLRRTGFGRQLRASGGDARIGQASGVGVARVRMLGSTLSGLVAGIGGSLIASHNMLANYELAGDSLAGLIFLLAAVGGVGTLIGPWIAAVLYFAVVRESLFALGDLEPIAVFGMLFVAIWLVPGGVGGVLTKLSRRRWLRRPRGSR